ncbi:5-methylthioadenosine/S-adenosylhomocysteine deaminase [Desulfohalotomaculum tongense]|uniref:amidohydrolase n=1 Tax=Desulforadius tongensis TaxID=1216062 RepID=UPI00195BFDCB|nr:amidohydrolase [Desulforadius tongensis]MBM7854381.1 5-methylthioadenosine/S-adenosylhomocysteine deaminase [Desulforadius tongensis]
MSQIIIRNVDILTMTEGQEIIKKGEIAISGNKILSVGEKGSAPENFEPAVQIDGSNMVAMPGFVNCHTHAAMTLLRGYADDLPLMEWLNNKIWPLEAKMKAEDIYWGTLLACVEMIKSGTTTFADMYAFMDQAAEAAVESGMRAVLARGLIGVAPNGAEALEESRDFISRYQGAAGGRITTMLGPHAPYTCPPDYLEKVMGAAEELGVGIHIHLAETLTEERDIVKQYGRRPVQHLEGLGLFNYPTLAAHCVHVDDEDIRILAENNVGVAHNPESNMKLASGIAPVQKMLAAGVKVGLGTDGASSNNNLDMLEEMRTAALLQKVSHMDPTAMPAYKALEMATAGGAGALGLENEVGRLKAGLKADIILVNFNKPHLYPRHDICAHMVYSAHSADVDTVIIDGELVMQNRKILTLDEEEIFQNVDRCIERLMG